MTQFYDLWSNLDSLPSLPPPSSEGPSLSELINYIGDRPPHTFHQHLTLFDCCSESQESLVPSKQHCTIAIYFSLLYILAIQVPETPQFTRQAWSTGYSDNLSTHQGLTGQPRHGQTRESVQCPGLCSADYNTWYHDNTLVLRCADMNYKR